MINSKEKGKRGELEVAHLLKEKGFNGARGVQYKGGSDSPDVTGLPGVHIEVKYREALNVYDAMNQSKREAAPGELPVVFHRKNRTEWLVTMTAEEFLNVFMGYFENER